MRFTSNVSLPESVHATDAESWHAVEEIMLRDIEAGSLVGFDTETSGLEGDGLGVHVHYICLATSSVRVAVPTSGKHAFLLKPVGDFLKRTQHLHAGFNIIYDWNALYGYTKFKLGWAEPLALETCYADGMTLFNRFDEEGEETFGQRGLKARAGQYLGLPMASFDWILKGGGILEAIKTDKDRALDYCTRDGWAHLGLVVVGELIASKMSWCYRCPSCSDYMFTPPEGESYAHSTHYECASCGPQPKSLPLNIMDWHRELDVPFLQVLHKMQRRGVTVDWTYLKGLEPHVLAASEGKFRDFSEEARQGLVAQGIEGRQVNPGSALQLRGLYYAKKEDGGLGYPAEARTKTGAASTDADSLDKLLVKYNPPGLSSLMQYRDLKKIYSTYIIGLENAKLPETGKIHGTLRPVTKTGRLASRNPNLQNLPARDLEVRLPALLVAPAVADLQSQGMGLLEANAYVQDLLTKEDYLPTEFTVSVRKSIVASPGKILLCSDYAQLEVRLSAIESGDQNLIQVINDGIDMHCYTAGKAFTSVFPWLDYDLMYEARQFLDGDPSLRFGTLKKMAADPAYLDQVLSGRLSHLTKTDHQWINNEVLMVVEAAEEWDDVFEALGPERGGALQSWLAHDDRQLKNLRNSAKSAIFGILYGIGPVGLAVQITKATGEVCDPVFARDLISEIKDGIFPGIGGMMDRFHDTLRRFGHVRTRMGRYRHPAGAFSGDSGIRARARRQSVNSPIQGLAADVVQRAMIQVDNDPTLKDLGSELLLQVHDELLAEAPEENGEEALARMSDIMRYAHGMVTPVLLDATGSCAYSWDEAK